MDGTLELEGGGRLAFREEGLQVRLDASSPDDGLGLYKVWIHGTAGTLLLGTLAPEGGMLRLGRVLSRRSLMEAGCWPITGGQVQLSFPLGQACQERWTRADQPERLLPDPILAHSAAGSGPFLLSRTPEGFLLAAPLRPDYPFPLVPLFCFARVEELHGTPHAVFSFRADGTPLLPV